MRLLAYILSKLIYRYIYYCLAISYSSNILTHATADATSDPSELVKDKFSTVKFSESLPRIHEDERSKNYASVECAKVVETNLEAKKASHIINGMTDEYMLNPCKAKIWFVIELCEKIQATRIEMANYELFSSMPKDFTVYFSDMFPALDWKLVGQFTAIDTRTLQSFDLNQVGFGKFIKVELHSHYGTEHYCPISEVKVYGDSMVEEYEKSENSNNAEDQRNIKRVRRKPKRKTSAHKVYFNVMTGSQVCGLSPSLDNTDLKGLEIFNKKKKKPPTNLNLPQPTQQPAINRTSPLKPSIFVELSNKVKALEVSLKNQIEEIERKTETKFYRLTQEFRSIALIAIAYCVYKFMLDLM